MQRLRRGVLGFALAGTVLVCVAVAAAQRPATVRTTDGRELTGELVSETDQQVTLRIAGIDTPLPRDIIESVTYRQSPAEEFAERRAELADDDLDGRYRLAYWAFEQRELELARQELDALAEAYPDDNRVTLLRRVVAERIKLMQEAEQQPRPTTPPSTPPTPAVPTEARPSPTADLPTERLTDDQINRIRLYELPANLIEARPIVVVPPDVIEDLLVKYADRPEVPKGRTAQAALRRAPAYEKLDLIFKLRAREYYDKIRVRSEPPAITAFKTQVHQRYVLQYCASNQCHGGTEGGDLFLFRSNPTSDPTLYTNFYILHAYRSPTAYMIDRDQPDRSLLLQYGMAREIASMPHPQVPGWAPEFRVAEDPRLRNMLDALRQLWRPTPDYGIDYQIPRPGAGSPTAPDAEEGPGEP